MKINICCGEKTKKIDFDPNIQLNDLLIKIKDTFGLKDIPKIYFNDSDDDKIEINDKYDFEYMISNLKKTPLIVYVNHHSQEELIKSISHNVD